MNGQAHVNEVMVFFSGAGKRLEIVRAAPLKK